MKSPEEIQAAHDRLVAVILGDVPSPFAEHMDTVKAAADALCWVLDHCNNPSLGVNLQKLDRYLAARGFALTDTGRGHTR